MPSPSRFLSAANAPATDSSKITTGAVDSDFVVILAALVCALICVLGLVAVARCTCLRRFSPLHPPNSQPAANKGLKKKVLRSLPKYRYSLENAGKLEDCAICLTEFTVGEKVRELPQCGHVFHVPCIDMWLGSHSTCPSCRQILAGGRCQRCGGLPPATAGGDARLSTVSQREADTNSFLP